MIKIIVITIIILLVIGNIFTYPLQQFFLFQPVVLDQDYRFHFKSSFKEINLKTEDGGNINALHFKNSNAKGVIIYFHGNAGNLVRWGQLNDEFSELGYDLFIMDFRGFGKSTGKLSESSFYKDAEQCYDYVSQQYDANQTIIYGRSMGSGPASYLASKIDAKHLILETPFYSIKNLFYTYYPLLPRLFIFKFRFPNFSYLKTVNFPITIFQGTDDFVVPYKGSKKLKEVLKPSDEYITIEGGTHSDLVIFEQYQDKLAEILD